MLRRGNNSWRGRVCFCCRMEWLYAQHTKSMEHEAVRWPMAIVTYQIRLPRVAERYAIKAQ